MDEEITNFDSMMFDKLMKEFDLVHSRWIFHSEALTTCIMQMKQIKFDMDAINRKYNKLRSPL